MIVDQQTAAMTEVPHLPLELFEMIHNVSMFLILEDKKDIGRFQYYDRTDYYWKGRFSPDHPSPWHHYHVGIFGLLISQIGSVVAKGLEMFDTYRKIESGDLSEVDRDILDIMEVDNTISLDDYTKEVKKILPTEEIVQKPVYQSVSKSQSKPALNNPLKVPNQLISQCVPPIDNF